MAIRPAPVVIAEFGAPVTLASNRIGAPLAVAENGLGMPVALAESGGTPVVIDNLPMALGASLLAWWDPSDLSTLFQDSAGTTPVTAANDPVGMMRDKSGNGRHWTTADAARPLWDGVSALICNGTTSFMNIESQPFPSGANPCEIWAIVRQDALAADTTVRSILTYGNSTTTATRALRRVVVSAVNRLQGLVGNGAGQTINETTVDFSGVHVVRMVVGATQTVVYIDGVASSPLSVVPTTGTLRARLGSNTAASAAAIHNGKIGPTMITGPLTADEVRVPQTYYASVSLT